MKIVKIIATEMAKASHNTAIMVSAKASLFSYHQPKEPKAIKAKK